jgi:hypothetical protein
MVLNVLNLETISKRTIEDMRISGFNLDQADVNLLLLNHKESIENRSTIKLMETFFQHIQNNNVGVCCFSSEIKDRNQMWCHYADEARGLCLVFDKEELIKSLKERFNEELRSSDYRLYHRKINYKGVKPITVKFRKDGRFTYQCNHLFSKTKHWSSEAEYRFIIEKFQPSPFDFEKFQIFPFMYFDDECLKYVIMGQRIKPEHQLILNHLKDKSAFKAELLINLLEN